MSDYYTPTLAQEDMQDSAREAWLADHAEQHIAEDGAENLPFEELTALRDRLSQIINRRTGRF